MAALLVNLYWSLLIVAFGLCVGSFLNVVIYRWPRDFSIRRPLWSFCPHCRHTLTWRDNLPVVSYVLLRGRCRSCRVPISLQYPLVELITAFSFLLIYDAFFVAKLRDGITDLSADWPMLAAHWFLAAGLIVLTVMDLEAYLVDIRVTWLIAAAGLLLHGLWTPASSFWQDGWLRPGAVQATVAAAAAVGLCIGALLFIRRLPQEPAPGAEGANIDGTGHEAAEAGTDSVAPDALEVEMPAGAAGQGGSLGLVWLVTVAGLLVLVGYVVMMLVQEQEAMARLTASPTRDAAGKLLWPATPAIEPGVLRTGIGLIVLFVTLTVFASQPHPEEDEEIIESLAAEAVDSRRQALWELRLLSPALVLMVAGLAALLLVDGLGARVDAALHTKVWGHWRPLWGLSTALAGWIVGGGLAWSTRVLGTLGLGKEALGMGDVHIMAAVGAVAGVSVAFLGFFIASPLALAGILVIHLRRQSRALPYGPWLALGAFLVVLYQDRILPFLWNYASVE